jgi:predicted nucleotidyltransferase
LRFFFEEISGNSLQDRLLQRKKERKKRTVLMFSPHDISINKQKFYWWDLSYQKLSWWETEKQERGLEGETKVDMLFHVSLSFEKCRLLI